MNSFEVWPTEWRGEVPTYTYLPTYSRYIKCHIFALVWLNRFFQRKPYNKHTLTRLFTLLTAQYFSFSLREMRAVYASMRIINILSGCFHQNYNKYYVRVTWTLSLTSTTHFVMRTKGVFLLHTTMMTLNVISFVLSVSYDILLHIRLCARPEDIIIIIYPWG